MSERQEQVAPDQIGTERARLFALLGRLLGAAPDAGLLIRMRALRGEKGALGQSYGALAEAAGRSRAEATEQEFAQLFLQPAGEGPLHPHATSYRAGPVLAALRADLDLLGIGRAEGVAEAEDHIAFLCEAYAGLLAGAFPVTPEAAPDFFTRHIQPWAARFFADLEQAPAADFYRAVGTLGREAMALEASPPGLPA